MVRYKHTNETNVLLTIIFTNVAASDIDQNKIAFQHIACCSALKGLHSVEGVLLFLVLVSSK